MVDGCRCEDVFEWKFHCFLCCGKGGRTRILICKMKELLDDAELNNKAVGAFSIANMEMVMGVLKAAEELNTPVIIQVAEARFAYSPLAYIGPMMVQAAKEAKVDVGVHLDHGITVDAIKEAYAIGFTSVMFDGSRYPLEENIKKTEQIAEFARMHGLTLEAELGVVGGSEGGAVKHKMKYTDPEEARVFVQKTEIDALAVAVGNVHGHYAGDPQLNFEVLKEISGKVRIPLVLHGGSGIYPEEFRKCIDLGIRKINIGTASCDALVDAVKEYLETNSPCDYFSMNEKMVYAVYEKVKECIAIFNNKEVLR